MGFVRTIGKWGFAGLVINSVIGSAIFGVPGELNRLLGPASPLILILGGVLLPLVPSRLKKGYLLFIPVLVFARTLMLVKGTFGQVSFLDWTLVFGRVDALSLVFGYIMSLMCILGTLYGLHVKDDKQHIAAWFYVAGSIGAIYAGDFLTLFLFWELMLIPSYFIGYRLSFSARWISGKTGMEIAVSGRNWRKSFAKQRLRGVGSLRPSRNG